MYPYPLPIMREFAAPNVNRSKVEPYKYYIIAERLEWHDDEPYFISTPLDNFDQDTIKEIDPALDYCLEEWIEYPDDGSRDNCHEYNRSFPIRIANAGFHDQYYWLVMVDPHCVADLLTHDNGREAVKAVMSLTGLIGR